MNKKEKRLLAPDLNASLFFRELYSNNFTVYGPAAFQCLSGRLTFVRKNVNLMSHVEYESSKLPSKFSDFELKNENNENLKIHLGYTDNFLSYYTEEYR